MVTEIINYCLTTGLFLFMTCLGLFLARYDEPAGLLIALFCSAVLAYYLVTGFRDFFTEKGRAKLHRRIAAAQRRPRQPLMLSVRGKLVWVGIICISILLGIAEDHFTFIVESWLISTFAIWLGAFVFGLVSYPLQKRQADGVESLALWSAISAALALFGILVP